MLHSTELSTNVSACKIQRCLLKAPASSKIDILLSKKGLLKSYMVIIQSENVAHYSL